MMNWIRKAPTAVTVAALTLGGVVTVAFLAGFVVLELNGRETADYRGLVNLAMNAATTLLAAIAAIGATSAARSSSNAEDQTNGTLTKKDAEIAVLRRQLDDARRGGL